MTQREVYNFLMTMPPPPRPGLVFEQAWPVGLSLWGLNIESLGL